MTLHPDIARALIRHGTITAYNRHKCRCAECRARKSEYRLQRKGLPTLPRETPCVLPDGSVAPSQNAAARALGVSGRGIAYHLNRYGDLSSVGRHRGAPRSGPRKSVQIGDRSWPSRTALARYVGERPQAICKWIGRGDMDRLLGAIMRADAAAYRVAT